MSSKSVGKTHKTTTPHLVPEEPIKYSNIVIPFSEFGNKKRNSDIYVEEEKIPFRKRHPTYQTIFKNEFSNL
ncbi:MAG: hypothetical protein ACFE9N_00915 [Promethearchaeota archaeon]